MITSADSALKRESVIPRANCTNFGGRNGARLAVDFIRPAQATFASVSSVSSRSHALRSAATFYTNHRAAAHQPALPLQRHSFQSLEVAMGTFTGLTSSAAG